MMLQQEKFELLNILASYVPSHITRRLAEDPTPIDAPLFEYLPGAILFADISGFTALAEHLAQRGPVGAEELSNLLNTYLGELIDIVTTHGGDIVKFAGDGLIALWPADAEPDASDRDRLTRAAHRAAQCSLEAQQRLNDYQAAPDVKLSIKIGLGVGDVLAVHLGSELNRWEFLVTGEPIVQAGNAEKFARPGEIILSPEVWALLRNVAFATPPLNLPTTSNAPAVDHQKSMRLIGLKQRLPLPPSPRPQASLSPKAEAALRAYIPGAILSRLDAGQYGWLAELRRVTVIFVNLPDLNYKTPLNLAQTIMRTLQKSLYRYEGSINKLGVDEKGVMLLAAMGLPPLAHEDDPARGVQVALDMQAEIKKLGLRSAIGITTGRAFCGVVGNHIRREYTMHGDTVNLAARLMQAAGDTILCDEATYRAAHSVVVFDPLPPITVKGKSQPVAVYQPVKLRDVTRPAHTDIVDRADERRQLMTRLEQLQSGRSSVVIIEGEAGIGKSRLIGALLYAAETRGLTGLLGGGKAIDSSTPYHAWRPIFKQLFRLDQLPDTPAARHTHILQLMQSNTNNGSEDGWLRLAPLLNAVLPLDWPENEITRQMTGKVRADNTHDLLIEALRRLADPPYLIILEDAHWLDSASWALTAAVADRLSPLLLALATRPMSTPPPEYTQLQQLPTTDHIRLLPMSDRDTITLVCQRLGVNSLPDPLANLLRVKTEGNPFFGEELAFALRDAGLIQIQNGQCQLASQFANIESLHLPDTIQGVITSRIDRLTPGQQFTLKVASVIGPTFEYSTLYNVHPIATDKSRLLNYLDTLTRLDITQPESPPPDLAYIFKQLTTQEVAYNMLLYAQRRELHRSVAQWYERTYRDELSPYYPLLAHHWQAAEEPDRAIKYLEKAGEQALHNYANEEAVEFFSRAIALNEQSKQPAARQEKRAYWELNLGQAYINWAKLSEGRVHLERGLALLGYPVPSHRITLAIGIIGQLIRQTFYRLVTRHTLGWLASRREALLQAARAYEGLAAVYYFANDDLRTLYAAFRSLNLAEAAGSSPELARSYALVGVILSFVPLHRLAVTYCQRALEMAARSDDLPAQAWVSLLTAVYYTGVARWSEAAELYEQVIQIAETLGDHSRWHDAVGNLAALYYFNGQLEQSSQRYDDLLASTERHRDVHNKAWALRGRVHCLLPQGAFDEALRSLETIETILARYSDIVDEALNIDLYGLTALVHLRQGNLTQARAAASHAINLISKTSSTSYLSLAGYASVAETFITLWLQGYNVKTEMERASKALRSFARVFPIGQPQSHLWQGVLKWEEGRQKEARKLWGKGIRLARQLDMPYTEAMAHYEIGRRLPANSAVRTTHLKRAKTLLSRLQAWYDLEQVKKIL